MKKVYLIVAGCLAITIASPALAVEGFYFGVEGGASFLNDADWVGTGPSTGVSFTTEYDTGYVFGGVYGYQFQSMRIEAELVYRQNSWNDVTDATVTGIGTVASFEDAGIGVSGETNVFSGMVNGYLDLHNSTPFTPYIMGGVGVANVEITDVRFGILAAADEDDTVLAWQVGAGMAWALNQTVSLSVDYRYFATTDPEFTDVDFEYNSHNIMASVLFHL